MTESRSLGPCNGYNSERNEGTSWVGMKDRRRVTQSQEAHQRAAAIKCMYELVWSLELSGLGAFTNAIQHSR